MPCADHGQGVFHTSLACQYQALSHTMFEMNTFSTAALCGAFLAPACGICGAVAQRLKLPRITGFLVAGVAAGPYALKLLTDASLQKLWIVDQACLSLIALAAGAELQWEQLEKIHRQASPFCIACQNDDSVWCLQIDSILQLGRCD